jgi:hypothetical protein
MLRCRQMVLPDMLKVAPASFAFVVLVATPLFAQDEPTEAEREAFIAAVTANGCQMTEMEAPIKLPAAGIDKDTSGQIVVDLITEGLAEVSEEHSIAVLTLKTEGCAP